MSDGITEAWKGIKLDQIKKGEEVLSKEDTIKKKVPIRNVVEFAVKIAEALRESRSSTAWFFVQQAYPDDSEEYNSCEELLNLIIIQGKIFLSDESL